METTKSIAIIGCGFIGQSWAMLFVAYGYRVRLYDLVKKQVDGALSNIREKLKKLEESGTLRGRGSAEEQAQLVQGTTDLGECLAGVIHVQECVFESVEVKKSVFIQLDELADVNTVLASSSSAIPCSQFTESLRHRNRCIIAHPVNPPYYMSLVELVPAPWTSPEVMDRTYKLMTDIGQSPVVLKKEVQGFIQPRIQYAIIMECIQLVQEEVLDVDDVDKLIKEGLGLGYTFIGPLESLHLSHPEGFRGLFAAEGDSIKAVCDSLGPAVPMDHQGPLIQNIHKVLCETDPVGEGLARRRVWRDERLALLAQLKQRLSDDK